MDLFLRIDIDIVSLFLLSTVFIIAFNRLDKDNEINKNFLHISLFITFQLILEITNSIIDKRPEKWLVPISIVLNIFAYSLSPLVTYFWCVFINSWVMPHSARLYKKYKALFIPIIINCLLTLSAPFNGLVFTVSNHNEYSRGTLFLIPVTISYFYLFYSFLIIIKNKNSLIRNEFPILMLFGIIPGIGGLLQVFFSRLLIMWAFVTAVYVVIYIYIQQRMMQIDNLTEAWTRNSFEQYIEQITKKNVLDKNIGFIYIDMDGFKHINDTFGHLEGDMALKNTVKLIKDSISKTDIVSRYGGDEFVVLIEDTTNEKMEKIVKSIEGRFDEYNKTSEKGYILGYSCGYEIYDPILYSISEFLNYIDHLMYLNKKNKKKGKMVFN